MKKSIVILILITSYVLLFGGCAVEVDINKSIKGEGEIVSRSFETGDFTGIDIGGSKYVTFQYAESGSVIVEMHENLFEYLEIDTTSGILHVGFGNDVSVDTGQNIARIHVYSPLLTSAELGGSVRAKDWDTINAEHFLIDVYGSADITIPLETESLIIGASGSAVIELSGNADNVIIDKSGSVKINAFDLQTTDAVIESSGSGMIEIAVSNSMKADLSGSGSIRYIGSPAITQDVSGSGKIEKISD